jgi:hypothetical protein
MRISIIIGFVALASVIGSALLAAFGQGANQTSRDRGTAPITIDPSELTRAAGPMLPQFYEAI